MEKYKYKYNKYKKKYLLLNGGTSFIDYFGIGDVNNLNQLKLIVIERGKEKTIAERIFPYTYDYYTNLTIRDFVENISPFKQKNQMDNDISLLTYFYHEYVYILFDLTPIPLFYDYDIILTNEDKCQIYSHYNISLNSDESRRFNVINREIKLYIDYYPFKYSSPFSTNIKYSGMDYQYKEDVKVFLDSIRNNKSWFNYKPFLKYFIETEHFIKIIRNIDPFYKVEIHHKDEEGHTDRIKSMTVFGNVISQGVKEKHTTPILNMFEKLLEEAFFKDDLINENKEYNDYIVSLHKLLPVWLQKDSKVIQIILFHARNLKKLENEKIIPENIINDEILFTLITMDAMSPHNKLIENWAHFPKKKDVYSSEFETKLYENEWIKEAREYRSKGKYDTGEYWKNLGNYHETLSESLQNNENVINKMKEAEKTYDMWVTSNEMQVKLNNELMQNEKLKELTKLRKRKDDLQLKVVSI